MQLSIKKMWGDPHFFSPIKVYIFGVKYISILCMLMIRSGRMNYVNLKSIPELFIVIKHSTRNLPLPLHILLRWH